MKQLQNQKKIILLFIFNLLFTSLYTQEAENLIQLKSDWHGSIFGNVGGDNKITHENFTIEEEITGTIAISSRNNKGKIATDSEGIAFVYKEINSSDNFTISATARVKSFLLNNQVSFGLMIRDTVYYNVSVKKDLGSYLASGPVDTLRDPYLSGFSRVDRNLTKSGPVINTPKPMPGAEYNIKIIKSGHSYSLQYGDEEPVVFEDFEAFQSEKLFVGMFTARNAEVEFENIHFEKLENDTEEIIVTGQNFKKSYLIGEKLNIAGLKIEQITSDGTRKQLQPDQVIISGFDSSYSGSQNIRFHYNGKSASVPIEINELSITSIELLFPPLKTDYHLMDKFTPRGIQVQGIYNKGFKNEVLNDDEFTLTIDNEKAENIIFNEPGSRMVKITSLKNPAGYGSFRINVSSAQLYGLEISRQPTLQRYYKGDQLDTNGLNVYALYSDNSKVRLKADEYNVGNLDTSVPGVKNITVSHKGVSTRFLVYVYALNSRNMVVSRYPKTTYALGESFDKTNMEVSKLFNNGTYEFVDDDSYEIDTSAFDLNKTGKFNVLIIPDNKDFRPIRLPVTIKEREIFEWKSIRFGQSTKEEKNYTQLNDNGSLSVVALEGGGKVTQDHDGLTFYYTAIDPKTQNFELEADITVNNYAKNPHDGQESFGILARDSIGIDNDSSINASNIVAIGGYSGGTRNINGTQLIKRQGITSIDGAGSKGTKMIMLDETLPSPDTTYPERDYHLKLQKSNSGFHGILNGEKEALFMIENTFDVQDPKLYVGFYAARLASIDIHNMKFSVSESETDAPGVPAPILPKENLFEVLSPLKTSNEQYQLIIKTNFAGNLTVKKDFEIILNDLAIDSGQLFELETDLNLNSTTNISVVFIPDETQALMSYDTIIKYLPVEQKTYLSGRDIHVTPNGTKNGDGTIESPLDLDTAISFVTPGQKIIIEGGIYKRSTPLIFDKYNDGTPEAYKILEAAPGSRPVIDFKRIGLLGAVVSGNYWKIKGIDITHTAGNTKGMTVGGNYNIIEDCKFYENGDTGLSINRTDTSEKDINNWPSNNLILNCESYDNVDPSQNNADGFAAKITNGFNNVFRGCISHNNIDDGWDLYTKAGTGVIGAVLIEECITYENGTLTNGTIGKGDKNGFKLGGEGILVPHILRNSLAFNNGATGITNNSNPGIIIENSFSINNRGSNVSLQTYTNSEPKFQIRGLYEYPDKVTQDVIIEKLSTIPLLNIFIEQIFK